LILGPILAVTVVLGVMLALVRRPDVDEAWFAGAAWSLAFRGYMGTPLIEAANIGLQGIGERTYWILPLEPVMLAGWYKVMGFSLFSSRLFSICWAAIGVLALFEIVNSVTHRKQVAYLAAGLLGLDYAFLRGAASVRMDMMTLALDSLRLPCSCAGRSRLSSDRYLPPRHCWRPACSRIPTGSWRCCSFTF
jgi:4-amino-4-deoxy-L-arabinose transferase-like glycosyltransferase